MFRQGAVKATRS